MKASGNSLANVCAKNLLSLTRTECPFSREKGLATAYIDSSTGGEEYLVENIEELLDTYEPRLAGNTVAINYDQDGDLIINVGVENVTSSEEGEEAW